MVEHPTPCVSLLIFPVVHCKYCSLSNRSRQTHSDMVAAWDNLRGCFLAVCPSTLKMIYFSPVEPLNFKMDWPDATLPVIAPDPPLPPV